MADVIREDLDNQYSWQTIRLVNNDLGELVGRVVTRDDGVIIDTIYENGVAVSQDVFDNPDLPEDEGARAWTSVRVSFDDQGELASRLTFFDNGIVREQTYTAGVISFMSQYDNPFSDGSSGAVAWERIETGYDELGQIASRVTFFDDGTIKDQTFVGGVISSMSEFDNPDDSASGGAAAWERIETGYDDLGQISSRVTFFDNGTIREQTFVSGSLRSISEYDNPNADGSEGAKPWDRIETQYDDAGELDFRVTFFDDGVIREENFTSGVRDYTVEFDNPDAAEGTGARNWERKETIYDSEGKLSEVYFQYDDGTTTQRLFLDDGSVVTFRADSFENNYFDWISRGTVHDAEGNLVKSAVTYDNYDAMALLYEGGQLVERQELDEDYSDPWVGRSTFYGPEGEVTDTVYYNSYEELPAGYAGVLALIPIYDDIIQLA